ncbi:uncharacterized protein [Miscanthus floridulus]|uniref:uncharacterized protein n=1 Tax=Miscanthus floridulus TaxID=154761 RepID=UPI003458C55A
MRRFGRFLGAVAVEEIHLNGRLFTWTNERLRPTLERIDRAFASVGWLELYPNHHMRALSSDCSDHAPLLLRMDVVPWARKRFRFRSFWTKLPGFLDVVASAYLAIARKIILRLECAQDRRPLSTEECALRKDMKCKCLGLASLLRTIARQHSRLMFLAEGDANTRFFHLQACHRSRKNHIASLTVQGNDLVLSEQMADALYEHYSALLSTPFQRSGNVNFDGLGITQHDLSMLDVCFSEFEIWATIKELPSDKAPGPDGFTGLFYKVAWPIIKQDVLNAFNAF